MIILRLLNLDKINFYSALLFLIIFAVAGCADPPQINTPTVLGDRLSSDAFEAYIRHDYREALHLFQKALDRYKSVDNREKIARIQSNLANIYQALNLYKKALQEVNCALDIYNELDKQKKYREVLLTRAMILQADGKIKSAHRDLNDAGRAKKIRDSRRYNLIKANIQFQSGELDAAGELTQKILEAYKSVSEEGGISAANLLLARIYMERNNLKKAEYRAKKALEINRRRENPLSILEDLVQLGKLELELGKNKQAHNYFQRAYFIARLVGIESKVEEMSSFIDQVDVN